MKAAQKHGALAIAERLQRMYTAGTTLFVAIDGAGASGKTTLSYNIAKLLLESAVVHMDDFWKPSSEGNAAWKTLIGDEKSEEAESFMNATEQQFEHLGDGFDFERLRRQVLEPLKSGKAARYQIYDWNEDRVLDGVHSILPGNIVIIEGGTVGRRELREYFDFMIWIKCNPEMRLERALARDGKHMRNCWIHKWEPEWERYVMLHQPDTHAHLRLDGSMITETLL